MTFLFNLTSVKMEWTRQVLLNIAPKAKENPAIKVQARAVHMYGKASIIEGDETGNFYYR